MKKLKFLHCADLHLDMPNTSLGGNLLKSEARRSDQKEVLNKIITLCESEEVDLMIISGDLFEHDTLRKSTLAFIHQQFSRIPRVQIIIAPGNHDPYIPNSQYARFSWNQNVHIFGCGSNVFVFEDLNTRVYGSAFLNFNEPVSLINSFESCQKEYFNILAVHGTLDMNFTRKVQNPMETKQLDALGMDYIALGHFHTTFDAMGEKQNIYNPGSPEALGFDEEGPHGIFVGELSMMGREDKTMMIETRTLSDVGKTLSVKFIETGIRSYQSLSYDIDQYDSADSFLRAILGDFDGVERKDILLCLTLRGHENTGILDDGTALSERLESEFFHVRIKDETTPGYDFHALKEDEGFRGLFVRTLLEIMEKITSIEEKSVLQKALQYGLQALDLGRVDM